MSLLNKQVIIEGVATPDHPKLNIKTFKKDKRILYVQVKIAWWVVNRLEIQGAMMESLLI